MKQTNINNPVIIYRTDQPKKDGSNTFYIQLHIAGKKLFYSLKIGCTIDFYDEKNNRIKRQHPLSKEYNLIIDTQLQKATKIILDARIKDEPLSPREFEVRYKGKDKTITETNYISFVRNEIDLEIKKGDLTKGRINILKSQLNKIQRYKCKIDFKDINEQFLADYNYHLTKVLKNKKNTANNALKIIKKFHRIAFEKGLTEGNPFTNYKIKDEQNDEIKNLKLEEYIRIKEYYYKLDCKHKHYTSLKSFLFSCYTSLRYSDCKKFTLNDIENNQLKVLIQKTKNKTVIPLLSNAQALLNYDVAPSLPNLNTPSNQKYNAALKEVAKICNISLKLTTHVARHTFACIALNKGVALETVKAIMGHKKIEQTLVYAKLYDTTNMEQMAKLEGVF